MAGLLEQLPSPLDLPGGRRIRSACDFFNLARPRIIRLFRDLMYGGLPPKPENLRCEVIKERGDALEGIALRRELRLHMEYRGRSKSADVLAYLPKGDGPHPCIVALNFKGNAGASSEEDVLPVDVPHNEQPGRWPFKKLIEAGYAVFTAARNDFFFDDPTRRGDSLWSIYYPGCDNDRSYTAISAWAAGYILLLETALMHKSIDPGRIWIHGHSRLGKTALWAAANDLRFAGVISNDSGCCGAAISRGKEGETISAITTRFPHWFVEKLDSFADREDELPFDQHWLLALAAPRPLLVASAAEDLWASPFNEYLAAAAAGEVYQLFGSDGIGKADFPAPDTPVYGDGVGYYVRSGSHNVTEQDWDFVLNFLSRYNRPE